MLKIIRTHLKNFDTIINFSHSDTDGIGCSVVLKNYAMEYGKKFSVKLNSYNNIDTNLKNLTLKPNEILILTDVFPKDPAVLIPFIKTNQLIVIDHHESSAEFYNVNKLFFNIPSHGKEGDCATLLTYKLFKEDYNEHLESFCHLVNDYDLWRKEDPRSSDMNMLFNLYWEKMVDEFIDGRMTFTEKELTYINKEKEKFKNVYSSLEYFDIDDVPEYPSYFFITSDYINECCEETFKDHPEIKICFAFSPKSNTLSIRSTPDELNMGAIVTALGGGGGHAAAAGWRITPPFDITDVVGEVKKIMKGVADSI